MSHGWPSTVAEAKAIQASLREKVRPAGRIAAVRRLGGVDVHYAPRKNLAFASAVVLDAVTLEVVESAQAASPVSFPYVPGYLSFREAPVALRALGLLRDPPDLLFVDGQGLAHPRRFGLACHLGLLAGLPAVGVAKSRLVGEHATPSLDFGATTPLRDGAEVIGAVVRTRARVSPLYVSVGHRIGLDDAVDWVLRATRGFRLPEPTRIADRLSRLHPL